MAIITTDTFDRADGAMGTSSDGSTWTVQTGQSVLSIVSNACSEATSSDRAMYNSASPSANQYASGPVTVTGGNNGGGEGPGFMLRMATGAKTGYRVCVNGVTGAGPLNNIEVSQFINGANISLGFIDYVNGSSGWVSGHTLKVQVTGAVTPIIECFDNGVSIGTVTDNTGNPITSGKYGVCYSSTSGAYSIASFEGGTTSGTAYTLAVAAGSYIVSGIDSIFRIGATTFLRYRK